MIYQAKVLDNILEFYKTLVKLSLLDLNTTDKDFSCRFGEKRKPMLTLRITKTEIL